MSYDGGGADNASMSKAKLYATQTRIAMLCGSEKKALIAKLAKT